MVILWIKTVNILHISPLALSNSSISMSAIWLWWHVVYHLQGKGLFIVIQSCTTSSGNIKHITGVLILAVCGWFSFMSENLYQCCDSVVVHRLTEVKRLADKTYHNRIQQKRGIGLMVESLHHQGNIIAQKSKDGKGWCACVSLSLHACACMWPWKMEREQERVNMWLFVLRLIFSADKHVCIYYKAGWYGL